MGGAGPGSLRGSMATHRAERSAAWPGPQPHPPLQSAAWPLGTTGSCRETARLPGQVTAVVWERGGREHECKNKYEKPEALATPRGQDEGSARAARGAGCWDITRLCPRPRAGPGRAGAAGAEALEGAGTKPPTLNAFQLPLYKLSQGKKTKVKVKPCTGGARCPGRGCGQGEAPHAGRS